MMKFIGNKNRYYISGTYPSIIESKSKERQLEVKVLMNLWRGSMDVPLVVPDVLGATLVVEPVEEVSPDLSEPGVCDDVGLAIVLVGSRRENPTVDVCCNFLLLLKLQMS